MWNRSGKTGRVPPARSDPPEHRRLRAPGFAARRDLHARAGGPSRRLYLPGPRRGHEHGRMGFVYKMKGQKRQGEVTGTVDMGAVALQEPGPERTPVRVGRGPRSERVALRAWAL
jgi:hypothetical protein